MLSRRQFIGGALATLASRSLSRALAAAPAATQSSRPNVIFIISDDMNLNLGCYGYSVARTPNLDKLAKRGVAFKNAYCQYPVCNPARTSLLSGLRPQTTRIFNNYAKFEPSKKQPPLLNRFFHDQGYHTLGLSKVFHGDMANAAGKVAPTTDDLAAWEVYYKELPELPGTTPREMAAKGVILELWHGRVIDIADDKLGDGVSARRAVELVEGHAGKNEPFFLGLGLRKPHLPWIAPKKYFDLFPLDKMPLAKEPAGHADSIIPLEKPGDYPELLDDPAEQRKVIAAYNATAAFMDAQVGLVLDALERSGAQDHTIIVFTSDHGYHLGQHGMWMKNTLFEESCGVPLIMAGPGIAPGGLCTRTVEALDIYPTLADLCGLPLPPALEGQSLRPLLANPKAPWDRAAYTVVQRGRVFGCSVRTERYRYTEWANGRSGAELYDHVKDPHEWRNLAEDRAFGPTCREMRKVLRAVSG